MKCTASKIAFVLAIIFSAAISTSADTPLFSVTLDTPRAPLKSGAKLVLRVTVRNTSDHNIPFRRTNNPQSNEEFRYEIDVRDASGHRAPPSVQVLALEGQVTTVEDINNHAYWLKPGESYSDDLEVTKLFNLTHPGDYTVWVSKELLSRQPRTKTPSNPTPSLSSSSRNTAIGLKRCFRLSTVDCQLPSRTTTSP